MSCLATQYLLPLIYCHICCHLVQEIWSQLICSLDSFFHIPIILVVPCFLTLATYEFFLLPFFLSSRSLIARAPSSFASMNLLFLFPYQFFHPAKILRASWTDFGNGSFFGSTLFSSGSISFSYLCFSTLYRKRIA